MRELADKDEIARAGRIARFLELRTIELVSVDARILVPADRVNEVATLAVEHSREIGYEFDDQSSELQVKLGLSADAYDDDEEPESREEGQRECLVSAKIGFHLRYQFYPPRDLPDAEEVQKAMESFAKINGVYNAWPYFREILQNLSIRMCIPPITVPLLQLGPKRERDESVDSEGHQEDKLGQSPD